ncbi:MAG: efflux RND transporter periplasmic adaptor subunit [Deltaproteobacteria bacterium]|nr:efflux RND transporter periplasmic adaptor subunit [Deltaproteobacteria bacterium]
MKHTLRPSVESVGTLKPYEEVIVSSELNSILKNVNVAEGSAVTRGMILAELEDTEYRLDVERVKAALRQALAALDNLKREYQRKEALFKEELVTKQQFDDLSARRVLAEGEVDRAKVALSLAEERMAKTKIYSPLNGNVKDKKVTTGDYVRNGTPIFSIVKSNPLKLNFSVTEKDVSRLQIGQDVIFKVDAFPDIKFKGKLSTIYPTVDERTRTLQVEAIIENPKRQLKPGFFARVVLYTGPPKEIIAIPITAILYDNEMTKAFTVENNVAKENNIEIGNQHDEWVEIIKGLTAGEQLVVVGQHNLAGGMKVNVAR